MQITPIKNFIPFKGATVNITALSDTHGNLPSVDVACQSLLNDKNDFFEKEEDGKINFLIIGGDWFISGAKNGFLSAPTKPLIKFQSQMLNKFLSKIREKFPETKTLFVPGNHEFDGGAKLFGETIRDIDMDVVCSNLDFENSPLFEEAIDEGKVVSSKISFVTDDKDETKEYAILNLGIAPVNLSYYQSDLDGINLIENTCTAQKMVKPEQFEQTRKIIRGKIDNFKEEYPNGIVILTCHTGVGFADLLAEDGRINIIFDGHEHKDDTKIVNGIPIVGMNQNFNKLVNAKININDDGAAKTMFISQKNPHDEEYEEGDIGRFYKELFKKDLKKIYTLKVKNPDVKELSTRNIRSQNNYLANFVVDGILDSIKQVDDSVQIFALNASSIRNGFQVGEQPTVSPFEVSSCLDGINYNQGEIYVTELSGREISQLVLDNFLFNQIDTERNPLFHYSGIKIDKKGFLKAYQNGKMGAELCKYITLDETGEAISPTEGYKIANPEKFFTKSRHGKIRGLKNASYSIGLNVHDAFNNYFKNHPTVEVKLEDRIY